MASLVQGPRGTADVLPGESYRWQYVESKLKDICERFGYKEIRTPVFEHTELFARGVGETTDIVGKEMYTMTDKGGRSITLRPEGTAGVVRSFLQHGLLKEMLPVRAYYFMSCFRYEKPQAGRWRVHHQLGIELFGAPAAEADVEVILTAKAIIDGLGIGGARLEINSVGCKDCRTGYHTALVGYFSAHIGEMCETCKDRLARNPLRILDCKSPVCQAFAKDAPVILDFLCGECSEHFNELQKLLCETGVTYTINPRIVRGQDYYSRTVFEFIHVGAGAQQSVCGGGRYDRLAEYLGGDYCAGVGFGMGIERVLLVMEAEGVPIPKPEGPEVFLAFIGDAGKKRARRLCRVLQNAGMYALYDLNSRSLKAQLKYADRAGARYLIVIGDGEVESESASLRDMRSKSECKVDLEAKAILKAVAERRLLAEETEIRG